MQLLSVYAISFAFLFLTEEACALMHDGATDTFTMFSSGLFSFGTMYHIVPFDLTYW